MDALIDFFLPLNIWIQDLPTWAVGVFKVVTWTGDIEFYLLVMPCLFWCIDSALGLKMGIMLLVSGAINSTLKVSFEWPRPFWVSNEVNNLASGGGFGFPSGHSQNAAAIWGLLAANTPRRLLRWSAGGLIFLIGLSRIVLGVHFGHDVLAGWLVGLLLLVIFLQLEKPLADWFRGVPPFHQLLALVGATGLLLIPASLIISPINPPQLPADWIQTAGQKLHPYSFDNLLTTAGAFFGLGGGLILLHRESGLFSAAGRLSTRLLRYLVGILGVVLLYAGLGAVFPDELNLISFGLRFFRYFLIGLWISYAAPKLFFRLNLLEKNHPRS